MGYVIPTYEIASKVSELPKSNQDLLKLIQHKLARQFHIQKFPLNQKFSNLKKWQKIKSFRPELNIAYDVTKSITSTLYEPLYVAKAKYLPKFDERFVGFGR